MKQREEMEARMAEMEAKMAAERQNMEEEQRRTMQRIEEENRLRMDQMFQYMQNFASSIGQALPPPPVLFPPPQPPTTTPMSYLHLMLNLFIIIFYAKILDGWLPCFCTT